MGKQQRLELQGILEGVLGSSNVYFQPGEGRQLEHPCFVYERDDADVKRANNLVYAFKQRYTLTYMDHNPDADMIEKVLALPYCSYDRWFATSGLNHDVFVIYH